MPRKRKKAFESNNTGAGAAISKFF